MSLRPGPLVLACLATAGGLLTAALAAESQPAASGVIRTRHAVFVPSRFGDLPGWRDERFSEAWKTFRAGCVALASRPAWADACKRSSGIDARADADIRRFLEAEFVPYEIRNADQSAIGTITGYYEPLLKGSRRYGSPYAYPVYGVPENLLLLDSRSIPPAPSGSAVLARIDGRNVVPVCVKQAGGVPCAAPFTLDIGDAKPDVRDKRIRVRREGKRIVPYYTRREIEKGALAMNGVIAWVDSLGALYSMQVQGSGKVRTPDGQILRLAFAEQNGHPFTPPVRPRTRGLSTLPEILTRGLAIPLDDEDAPPANPIAGTANASSRALTRGLAPPAAPAHPEGAASVKPADTAPPGASSEKKQYSPEVERMIQRLLAIKASRAAEREAAQTSPSPAAAAAPAPPAARPKAPAAVAAAPAAPNPIALAPHPSPPASDSQSADAGAEPGAGFTGLNRDTPFSGDPSFVFFRQIPDADAGPVGALGVPLTPGRSVAVDPRTTPLGAPVFISTEGHSAGTRFNRLMFAQDTGGAIRGAVRADFFWGFGPNAFLQASRMRESGRMWLLLPKDLHLAASKPVTRGIGGSPGGNETECLVPDPEFCVE
jgi:membrane-bound lytic murein transglycosylase A